jgi:signal transduction histidine kinase
MVMTLGGMSEALYALLDNLLTWSRVQRGMIDYHPQEIDVQKVVTRNVAIFTSNAEQKQITLRTAIQEQTIVYADKKMIDTIIRNLLSNALKFTHPGGNIEVSATQNGNYVTVSVTDTGIGIDEKHIPKLFRIDAQYKRVGTANEKGTGLGLILCQEFVERNGGKIWVESIVNKGTTFWFRLPKIQTTEGKLFF